MVQERFKHLLPPRSFRYVFSLLYVSIITAVIYFSLISQCSSRFLLGNVGLFILILVVLLGLELFERKRYGPDVPLRPAVLLLLVRMALFQAVAWLDCSGFSAFLYPLIPFSAYFSLGARVSNVLGLGYWLFYLWQYRPLLTSSSSGLFNWMVYSMLLLFMLIIARVIDSDERNQKNLEALLADLEATNVKLQLYAEQVAELAATEERNRLARDIHDSLGHRLTVVNIQLEKALAYKNRDPAEAEQAILDAKQAASEALQDVRQSVSALRENQEGFVLQAALAELATGMGNGRFTIDHTFTGSEEPFDRAALVTLYRAAQEGLTNIQKHASATRVTLHVRLDADEGRLILQDNGRGFDATTLDKLAGDKYHTFGLQGIQERLELVQGQMQIASSPAQGTTLTVTVRSRLAG